MSTVSFDNLRVSATGGLEEGATATGQLALKLPTTGGLEVVAGGLQVKLDGLTLENTATGIVSASTRYQSGLDTITNMNPTGTANYMSNGTGPGNTNFVSFPAGNTATVLVAGWFRIYHRSHGDNSNATRKMPLLVVEINGVDDLTTSCYRYSKDTTKGFVTTQTFWLVPLSVGDTVKLRIQAASNTGTITPDGSGSNVVYEYCYPL